MQVLLTGPLGRCLKIWQVQNCLFSAEIISDSPMEVLSGGDDTETKPSIGNRKQEHENGY